jgi:hypothetical protein
MSLKVMTEGLMEDGKPVVCVRCGSRRLANPAFGILCPDDLHLENMKWKSWRKLLREAILIGESTQDSSE